MFIGEKSPLFDPTSPLCSAGWKEWKTWKDTGENRAPVRSRVDEKPRMEINDKEARLVFNDESAKRYYEEGKFIRSGIIVKMGCYFRSEQGEL